MPCLNKRPIGIVSLRLRELLSLREEAVVDPFKVHHRTDVRPFGVLEVGHDLLFSGDHSGKDLRLEAGDLSARDEVEDASLENVKAGVGHESEGGLFEELLDRGI